MSAPIDSESTPAEHTRVVRAALDVLGKRNLLLSIHDASFPCAAGEEVGRGSPYSRGGHEFLRFAARLGFSGILFGPQGQTSYVNPSPYDGTIFSKNILSIALAPLAEKRWDKILDRDVLIAAWTSAPPGSVYRTAYHHVFTTQRAALRSAFLRFCDMADDSPLHQKLAQFCDENRTWLERDVDFESLLVPQHEQAERDPEEERAFYRFCQFVAHTQHDELRHHARTLDLKIYGDLQIGISHQDRTVLGQVFLSDYVMGAPPSRTNPLGQPWSYPVFDPRKYHAPSGGGDGPVISLVRARIAKLLAEFDGLRIDHPHGLICPWVYKAHAPDPLRAVQDGARLFSSPNLPQHEALAQFAIVAAEQLNRDVPRHADDWVRCLTEEQVTRYGILFEVILQVVCEHRRDVGDILCEVLSTQPFPLAQVMARYRMGRFRVTQKANLNNPADGYRSENAEANDWIMIGNHDTPPLWLLLEKWSASGMLSDHAEYLAERLICDPDQRAAFRKSLVEDLGLLAQAKLAELFASEAQNILIFFADLLGLSAIYNRPGEIHADNWTLRVPPDYESDYARKLSTNAALNIPCALIMALRARGPDFAREHHELITELESLRDKMQA